MGSVQWEKPPDAPRRGPLRRVDSAWARPRILAELLERWQVDGTWRQMVGSHLLEGVPSATVPMPTSLSSSVVEALRKRGIERLYVHQAEAIELASAGRNLVVATPTASGKSLCYHLPVLQSLSGDPSARALYLFPTKALSRDQEQSLRRLIAESGVGTGAITYDGDTPALPRVHGRECCSRIPTCFTRGSCRTTPAGRVSFPICDTSSSMSSMPTVGCLDRTSPTSFVDCCELRAFTVPHRPFSSPRPRSAIRRSMLVESAGKRSSLLPTAGHPAVRDNCLCTTRRWSTRS